MKTNTIVTLLAFSILSLSSCRFFKKCEGQEDVHEHMNDKTNAFYHFLPGERMVFTDGHQYDTAYWGEVVRYFDENNPKNYKCIGRRGSCCANRYYELAYQPLYFTSRDKNKPYKMASDKYGIWLEGKDINSFPMYATLGVQGKFKGILFADLCFNQDAEMQNIKDTTLIYSVSKGILSMKITNDDKSNTVWERVY